MDAIGELFSTLRAHKYHKNRLLCRLLDYFLPAWKINEKEINDSPLVAWLHFEFFNANCCCWIMNREQFSINSFKTLKLENEWPWVTVRCWARLCCLMLIWFIVLWVWKLWDWISLESVTDLIYKCLRIHLILMWQNNSTIHEMNGLIDDINVTTESYQYRSVHSIFNKLILMNL